MAGEKERLIQTHQGPESYESTRSRYEEAHRHSATATATLPKIEEVVEVKETWFGWLVVFASFVCIAVVDGIGYTTGLLQNPLMLDVGGSRAEVAFSGSLQVGVYSLSGPIVGRLVTEWGTRPVCILGATLACLGMLLASFSQSLGSVLVGYSVISGVGFGLMYIPSVVGAPTFFSKRRSLATGICLCGSGFGTFALAPLTEAILTNYGWRWVLRTFSAFCLVCILCGMCIVSNKNGEEKEEEEDDNSKPKSANPSNQAEKLRTLYRMIDPILFNNPNFSTFLLVVLADFSAFLGVYIPYIHLPPLAQARNISTNDAAFLISMGGISNTVGRLLGGWLCDQPISNPFFTTLISVLLSCIPALSLPRVFLYWEFLTLFSVFGLATGCMVGSTAPLLIRLLGLKPLSQTFGLMTAVRGVAALIGPPLAGVLVDYTEDKGAALDLSGIALAVSAIFYLAAVLRDSAIQTRRNYIEI